MDDRAPDDSMKLGLFLTPGAARAAYQVGAVKALVESGLRFDVVGASSVGALNGAFVAMGETALLAELWGTWRTTDITGIDWRELWRGRLVRARSLMHNRPQKDRVIDRYVREKRLIPGTRLRFNVTDLTRGQDIVLEWPGADLALEEAVNASVAVPVAIAPVDIRGRQWADGLTIDGFPLERVLLSTGVERAFVVGVAPRKRGNQPVRNAYQALLRAFEWNQYSETLSGLERAERVNAAIRAWDSAHEQVKGVIQASVSDEALRSRLLAKTAQAFDASELPFQRSVVQIVPILPVREIRMFFSEFDPRQSRALLRRGYRDANRALETFVPPGTETASTSRAARNTTA
jgi:NTE family protein